jgi:hypothetical protein
MEQINTTNNFEKSKKLQQAYKMMQSKLDNDGYQPKNKFGQRVHRLKAQNLVFIGNPKQTQILQATHGRSRHPTMQQGSKQYNKNQVVVRGGQKLSSPCQPLSDNGIMVQSEVARSNGQSAFVGRRSSS